MTKLIIENAILPAFRRNDFAGGIKAGVRDIRDVLLGDAEAVKERARGWGQAVARGRRQFPGCYHPRAVHPRRHSDGVAAVAADGTPQSRSPATAGRRVAGTASWQLGRLGRRLGQLERRRLRQRRRWGLFGRRRRFRRRRLVGKLVGFKRAQGRKVRRMTLVSRGRQSGSPTRSPSAESHDLGRDRGRDRAGKRQPISMPRSCGPRWRRWRCRGRSCSGPGGRSSTSMSCSWPCSLGSSPCSCRDRCGWRWCRDPSSTPAAHRRAVEQFLAQNLHTTVAARAC